MHRLEWHKDMKSQRITIVFVGATFKSEAGAAEFVAEDAEGLLLFDPAVEGDMQFVTFLNYNAAQIVIIGKDRRGRCHLPMEVTMSR